MGPHCFEGTRKLVKKSHHQTLRDLKGKHREMQENKGVEG